MKFFTKPDDPVHNTAKTHASLKVRSVPHGSPDLIVISNDQEDYYLSLIRSDPTVHFTLHRGTTDSAPAIASCLLTSFETGFIKLGLTLKRIDEPESVEWVIPKDAARGHTIVAFTLGSRNFEWRKTYFFRRRSYTLSRDRHIKWELHDKTHVTGPTADTELAVFTLDGEAYKTSLLPGHDKDDLGSMQYLMNETEDVRDLAIFIALLMCIRDRVWNDRAALHPDTDYKGSRMNLSGTAFGAGSGIGAANISGPVASGSF